MDTSHNDRITSARLLTFATDLWAKIKSTFYAKGESIGASDLPTISKDKLSSDVQTSLGKADTALQSFTETEPAFNGSAAKDITTDQIDSWDDAVETADTALNAAQSANEEISKLGELAYKNSLTASEVGAATSTDITNAINALDVSSVGGSGKYITTISETNGKISATSADFPAIPDVSGKLNVDGSNGTAAGVSALINKLTVGSDDSQGNDYFVCQYAGGGTEHTNYYRRPISKLWNYIKYQISSVLGLTSTQYKGNSATADYLKFKNVNEINFKNVPTSGNKHKVWFNYRNADTSDFDSGNLITEYNFGNRNAGTTGVTLKADSFSGNAATASCVKGNYSGTITQDICIRGATDGNLVIAAPGTDSEENTNHSIIFRLGGSINYTGNSTFNITTTGFDGNSSGTYNSRSYDNSGNDEQYVTSLASKRTTKVHCVYCNSSNYSTYGAPTSGWFLYETTGHADNDTYAIQTAQNYGGNRYFRSKSNGTWGSWKQVVNTGTSAVGSSSQPVYVNANGQVTACTEVTADKATKDGNGNNIFNYYASAESTNYYINGKKDGTSFKRLSFDVRTSVPSTYEANTVYMVYYD